MARLFYCDITKHNIRGERTQNLCTLEKLMYYRINEIISFLETGEIAWGFGSYLIRIDFKPLNIYLVVQQKLNIY